MINPINKVQTNMNNNIKQCKSQYEYIDDIQCRRAHSEQLQLYSNKGNKWIFQSKASWGSS